MLYVLLRTILSMRKYLSGMLLASCRRFIHHLYSHVSQTSHRWLWCACGYGLPSLRLRQRDAKSIWREPRTFDLARRGCTNSTLYRRSRLMSQYERVKQQYKDYILLFQVGDFYELYGDDASKLFARDTTYVLTATIITTNLNVWMPQKCRCRTQVFH